MTDKIDIYLEQFGIIAEEWFKGREGGVVGKYHNYFTKFFSDGYIETLSEEGVKELGNHLHTFNALRLAQAKAINLDNNDLKTVREAFLILRKDLDTKNPYQDINKRIQTVSNMLKYWGDSAISEIIGERFPEHFVFYNRRDQEACKFLEISLAKKEKGEEEKYIRYMKAIQPIIEKYKEIVDKKYYNADFPIGLKVDQFFSWLYVNHVVGGGEKIDNVAASEVAVKELETGKRLSPIIYAHFEKIEIKNYFTITDINLPKLSKEVYILGENGVGKTLLLQAMLLSTQLDYIKEDTDKGQTGIVLQSLSDNPNFEFSTTTTDIISTDTEGLNAEEDKAKSIFTNEKVAETEPQRDTDTLQIETEEKAYLKNIFAYGVNRGNHSSDDKDTQYEFLTLFSSDKAYLKNPNKWIVDLYVTELEEKGKPEIKIKPHISLEQVREFLKKLLDLKDTTKIQVDSKGVRIIEAEQKDTKGLTIEQLSDGYKSVMTWLIDMIARLSENQPNVTSIEGFKGILLIDELDLFLHPKWGYDIVKKLRKKLPEFQFIISTHSPILTLGASEDAIFYKLEKENGETKISQPFEKYHENMTANSLITSLLWELDTFTSRDIDPGKVSNDDDIYAKIHDAVAKKLKETPISKKTNDYVIDLIEKELARHLKK